MSDSAKGNKGQQGGTNLSHVAVYNSIEVPIEEESENASPAFPSPRAQTQGINTEMRRNRPQVRV